MGFIWHMGLARWQVLLQLPRKHCFNRWNHLRWRISRLSFLRKYWKRMVLPDVHARSRPTGGWLPCLYWTRSDHWLLYCLPDSQRVGLLCQGHPTYPDWYLWCNDYDSLCFSHLRCDCLSRFLSEQMLIGNSDVPKHPQKSNQADTQARFLKRISATQRSIDSKATPTKLDS